MTEKEKEQEHTVMVRVVLTVQGVDETKIGDLRRTLLNWGAKYGTASSTMTIGDDRLQSVPLRMVHPTA